MMLRYRATVFVLLFAPMLSCDSPTAPDADPVQVLAVSGTPQTGSTEDPLVQALVIATVDQKGRPVRGVAVAWSVDEGGGTLSSAATTTDSAGQARVQWTLGTGTGTFSARAAVQGLPPAIFSATAVWPEPAQVHILTGNGQDGAPGRVLADSLRVRITSAKGRPVPEVTVAWGVSTGGGSLSAATSVTDAAGVARVAWTLGAPGPNSARAAAGALPPASFAAFAVPVASVSLSHASVRLGRGDTTVVAATPRDSTGAPLAGRTITWATSRAANVTVSESGVLTGRGVGTATITATSEGKSASTQVTITNEDRTAPRLAGLSFSPDQVDVTDAPRTVTFLVRATDGNSGVDFLAVGFQGPSQGSGTSCWGPVAGNAVLASGTPHDGVWRCTAVVPKGATAGTWTIPQLNLTDEAGNQVVYTTGQIAAAGLPVSLTVVNTGPPATPPELTGLSFSPNPANVGASAAVVEITSTATASAGVHKVYVAMQTTRGQPAGSLWNSCSATTRASGTGSSGTWKCSIVIPHNAPGGTWRVNTLSVVDSAGNAATYSPSLLAARGIPHSFEVVSPGEDVLAPVLTGLTIDPATINLANGAKSVAVTLTASDAGVGASMGSASVRPESGDGRSCSASRLTGERSATFVCGIPFPAGAAEGKWSITVSVWDAVGNYREYSAEQLKNAGLPYEVTVTR